MNRLEDLMVHGRREARVSAGFEERVFAKIAKRRQQRRTAIITSGVSAVLGFAFALFLSLPRGTAVPSVQANAATPGVMQKEVVPVMEEVTFSTYGRNTHYAVEQVSLEEETEL